MSISPLKPSANQTDRSHHLERDRLTLSQALLITAGLAGLVGLFSGALIRFSLSNSDNARFLSPLQTFPALSNWAPELPQGTADAHYLPGGTSLDTRDGLQAPSQIQTFESVDEFSDEEQATEPSVPSTFDSFADRERADRRTVDSPEADPTEALQNGPIPLNSANEGFDRADRGLSSDRAEDGSTYPDSEYPGAEYPSVEYYEENYPEVEEPVYDDGSYYESQGQ